MIDRCAKCTLPATSVMSYVYALGEAWIDDLDGPIEPMTGHGLCELHANGFTAPQGWLLTDRRGAERPLFPTLEVA